MIEVSHLTKAYGKFLAVSDISFSVARGEIVGFLGPNGAGKSTTLKILSGFLGMDSGRVSVCGHDIVLDPLSARKSIGYMPESVPLYPEMRVREYVTFRAELKGVAAKERKRLVERAMGETQVDGFADTLIGKLSKGMRQRVGIADALVARPPLLILDEPTAGLDPNQIADVRQLVRSLAGEHTVFLSTHILPEVEATCGRAIVISKGKLVAEGSITELLAKNRVTTARLVVRPKKGASADDVLQVARGAGDVTLAEGAGETATLVVGWGADDDGDLATERVVSAVVAAGHSVREVRQDEASLEGVFQALTTEDGA